MRVDNLKTVIVSLDTPEGVDGMGVLVDRLGLYSTAARDDFDGGSFSNESFIIEMPDNCLREYHALINLCKEYGQDNMLCITSDDRCFLVDTADHCGVSTYIGDWAAISYFETKGQDRCFWVPSLKQHYAVELDVLS